MTSVSARVDVGSSTETSSGSTTHVRSTRYDSLPLDGVELDHVTRGDVLQPPEETVPVAGDADVAVRARLRRVLDVTDGAIERAVVGAGQCRHLGSNLWNAKCGERRRASVREHRFTPCPRRFETSRPERLVWRYAASATARSASETLQLLLRSRGDGDTWKSAPPQHTSKANGPAHSFDEKKHPAMRDWHRALAGA